MASGGDHLLVPGALHPPTRAIHQLDGLALGVGVPHGGATGSNEARRAAHHRVAAGR